VRPPTQWNDRTVYVGGGGGGGGFNGTLPAANTAYLTSGSAQNSARGRRRPRGGLGGCAAGTTAGGLLGRRVRLESQRCRPEWTGRILAALRRDAGHMDSSRPMTELSRAKSG